MITSHFDWEERLVEQETKRCLDSMASPSVEDAAQLAQIETFKYV